MKKFSSLLLAAAMVLSISGCGNNTLNGGTGYNSYSANGSAAQSQSSYPTIWMVLPEIDYTPVSQLEYKYNSKLEGIEITGYKGSDSRVRIPPEIDGTRVSVVNLKDYELTELVVPETVVEMQINDAIKYMNIPKALTMYQKDFGAMLTNLDNLEGIYLPHDLTEIGDNFLMHCYAIEKVIIPYGVTSIGEGAFLCSESLRSVNIPDGVTHIGEMAFYDCPALKNVIVPDSVKSVDEYVFGVCENIIITYKGKTYTCDTLDAFYAAVNG